MAVMAGYLPFLSDMNLFWLGMSGYWLGPCFTCWVQVGAGGCRWVRVGAGGSMFYRVPYLFSDLILLEKCFAIFSFFSQYGT